MRGIHDSGFETRALKAESKEEMRRKKVELLQKVIGDQKEILADTLGRDTLKLFVPYKEVLDLYDNGLDVPEDITLIWSNDNYGYVRRYPSEKNREGAAETASIITIPTGLPTRKILSLYLFHPSGHRPNMSWKRRMRTAYRSCGS